MNRQSRWIWYPGDFEIHHAMKQNFDREERGFIWPAFWKIDDCLRNVRFTRTYWLNCETEFVVFGKENGYVTVNDEKHLFGETIHCFPGENKIQIFVGNMYGLPCAYVEGEIIYSDDEWMVDDLCNVPCLVGYSSWFMSRQSNPEQLPYKEEVCKPVSITKTDKGILIDYGRTITGRVEISKCNQGTPMTVCYGESEAEALNERWCYFHENLNEKGEYKLRRRAFRYLHIIGKDCMKASINVIHQYIPYEIKGKFCCDNDMMNQIWKVATDTFSLCSEAFFIDGAKRDRWIWSGDAYQSYFINQYLFLDEPLNTRTIMALRGRENVQQHINTIVDYSLYWIISVWNHYFISGDIKFLDSMYAKLQETMEFCMKRTDENCFLIGKDSDWTFIDWADIDKEGPVCAIQILWLEACRTMGKIADVLGNENPYDEIANELLEKIEIFFWDQEKEAYIDGFVSGKRHITRHANIFAIIFGMASEEKVEKIRKNVLNNPEVPQITTPYFKFYELEADCKLGEFNKVYTRILEYWGGMIQKGATTFWEEYDPNVKDIEQYAMYGDPFGKSLCHAWGASPIYLLGKYFMGVDPLEPAYKKFRIKPELTVIENWSGEIPVKNGIVKMKKYNGKLEVYTSCSGGILELLDKKIELQPQEQYIFSLN